MAGDDLPHVRHTSVGNFNGIPVYDFCQGMEGGETGVYQLQEPCSNISGHILRKGWVKPCYIPGPIILPLLNSFDGLEL